MEGELKITDRRFQPEETSLEVRDSSPNAVIMMAMSKGYDPAFIEKMMELQERYEANEARKAYHKAMAAFKADPPKIWRDLQVKYQATGKPATEWSHSDLGTAADAINAGLGPHGLNATWRTEQQENNKIKVTCIITHELGHSESTWLWSPPDESGGKNSIQGIGSTIFYLERYTLFAITGLAPARMDDDGKRNGTSYITEAQQADLKALMEEAKADTAKFFNWIKAESLDKIPADKFKACVTMLEAKRKQIPKERDPGQEG